MIEIRLRSVVAPDDLEAMKGKIVTDSAYSLLLTGPARVLKPNGHPLAVYLPGVLAELMDGAYDVLHMLRNERTDNRGLASGTVRAKRGAQSRTRSSLVASAIIGMVDPGGIYPFCRLTSWTGRHLPEWESLAPLLQAIDAHLREHVPDRWAAQLVQAARTDPAWLVPGTTFSTVTVNNCVDPTTECLTKRVGWTTHDQLVPDDELLAYDPATNTTRWEPLLGVFVNDRYTGDMMALSSRGWSAVTTPDHRWPIRRTRPGDDRWEVSTSAQLPRNEWALVRSAPHEAPESPVHSDAFVRVVAWYFTEGNWRGDGRSITISQSDTANPHHVDSIRRDLKEIGCLPSEDAPWRGHRWSGRPPGLWVNEGPANQHPGIIRWLVTGLGVDQIVECAPGPDKVLSMAFLSSLTAHQARLFVKTCLAGDGSPERRLMYQHHRGRMDSFMVAAVLAGMAPSLGNTTWQTCALGENRSALYLQSVRRRAFYYEGTIWCPRLPSGHWVARRNGQTFITGNTYSTGVHTDKGDLATGFSTLAVCRRGVYTGGVFVLPRYQLGVDMQHGDLLLVDAHEWHGNTAIEPGGGFDRIVPAERISVVAYLRERITECEGPDAELAKAHAYADQRSGVAPAR